MNKHIEAKHGDAKHADSKQPAHKEEAPTDPAMAPKDPAKDTAKNTVTDPSLKSDVTKSAEEDVGKKSGDNLGETKEPHGIKAGHDGRFPVITPAEAPIARTGRVSSQEDEQAEKKERDDKQKDAQRKVGVGKSEWMFSAVEVARDVTGALKKGKELGLFATREAAQEAARAHTGSGAGPVYIQELSMELAAK